jgi:hypothetical protein
MKASEFPRLGGFSLILLLLSLYLKKRRGVPRRKNSPEIFLANQKKEIIQDFLMLFC